jgi:hypothetical protein
LNLDSDTRPQLLNTPFDDNRYVQLSGDLGWVGVLLRIPQNRARRAYRELSVQAESVRHRLCEGKGEERVLGFAGKNLEGEHGDGLLGRRSSRFRSRFA